MEKELISTIREKIPELTEESSMLIIDKLCRIQEPEFKLPEAHFEYITIDEFNTKGSSIKPGNIVLDMKKLLINSAEIGLTIAGVISTPYLIPLAALVVWNKVWSNVKIDLDENHAMTIMLMWENRDTTNNKIDEIDAYNLFNQYLKSKNKNEVILEDFRKVLFDLEKMQCIKKSGTTKWWLREWVKKGI
ncbi:hypothetical protein [uncultured Acetobacteroides sp.]|uniref:hypothetical protein n=1 Tax=uncultured Acetobacteroides sp. TaxID=1760811 RepID=UPI0029F51A39|nr:hypothetical protein [uncultured Acetobacteroides sp.]